MPCLAPPRGFTDAKFPWKDHSQNNPCGKPTLLTVGGVPTSPDNLCAFHWEQKYGLGAVSGALVSEEPGVVYGNDAGQAGIYVPASAPYCQTGAGGVVVQRGWFCRFVAPRSLRVIAARVAISVAASADDACDAGIYLYSGGFPLLGSAGSTLGKMNAVGVREIPYRSPIQLSAGQIYSAAFAYGAQGGAGVAQPVMTSTPHGNLVQLFGNALEVNEAVYANNVFPLPDPFPTATQSRIGTVPIMALVEG